MLTGGLEVELIPTTMEEHGFLYMVNPTKDESNQLTDRMNEKSKRQMHMKVMIYY